MTKDLDNKRGKGRPTKYTKALVDELCLIISTSHDGLHKICSDNPQFPHISNIMRWLADDDKLYFREQYARARELQAEFLFQEITDIAHARDNDREAFVGINHIQRDRLIVDTKKWQLSKLLPKKYGDKLDLTSGGEKLPNQNTAPTTVVIIENPNGKGAAKKGNKD